MTRVDTRPRGPYRCYRCKPKVKILINALKARTEGEGRKRRRERKRERERVSDRGFNGIRKCYVSNYEAVFSEFTMPCYVCNTFIPSPLRNSIKSIRAIRRGAKLPGLLRMNDAQEMPLFHFRETCFTFYRHSPTADVNNDAKRIVHVSPSSPD